VFLPILFIKIATNFVLLFKLGYFLHFLVTFVYWIPLLFILCYAIDSTRSLKQYKRKTTQNKTVPKGAAKQDDVFNNCGATLPLKNTVLRLHERLRISLFLRCHKTHNSFQALNGDADAAVFLTQ